MKDKPLVSIVTPSYNQGNFIEDTILSVKRQNYPNIEHIIVDGGSTDNTLEILKKYDDKYNMCWISEPDGGQSDAVNKGFEMAKGDIIGWLNSDDVYFSTTVFSHVVEEFAKRPEVDVIYGNLVAINEENLILGIRRLNPWFIYKILLLANFIPEPSTFLKRDVIKEHKIDISLDLVMDYEYWLRLVNDGFRFKYTNKLLSAIRLYPNTKTNSRKNEMKIESRKVQEQYGLELNPLNCLYRLFDLIYLRLLRIYAGKTLISIFRSPSEQNLAFNAKFDSILAALKRQWFEGV